MLKLLGALLVILAGTLTGFQFARLYAERPRQIRGLIAALQRLESEITYGYSPLPEAMKRLAVQSREPLRSLFRQAAEEMEPPHSRSAEEALGNALRDTRGVTALKAPETEIMRQLSCTLGTSDREDQRSHIALALHGLRLEETAAREEQAKYEKMSKSLGLLLGALIVILIF